MISENVKRELNGLLSDGELGHMTRVGFMVETLAAKLAGIDRKKAKMLGDAAYYHDVGKIYVPRKILLKRGRLTSDESNLVRMHCVYGQLVLTQMNERVSFAEEYLNLATASALYHHERWDGGGYPFGLKAKEIPLLARLTSICDTYDAITSVRPYRRGKQHEQACAELERYAGIQFDPELVDIFLEHGAEMKTHAAEARAEPRQPGQ
ncbi:HD domain-containing protein [Sporobacter termitidis DSM 10068]|uniref:HD domain-containing protein n=1 Tax=Sporobacter termitidis DSM 10068 TaxID=1123282 RepID=A0A1M5Z410_9FIRM|nr:HD domain-containing phosphohydrolase [Sporobacter termitidis]SHI19002.1 HD domain-containing protein [Sporobacter termitidis DSM 10068]